MKIILLVLSLMLSLNLSAETTFIYCSEGSPSSFNPQVTTDGTSNNASGHTLYDRLVDFKEGTTQIEPSLAKKWEVSKDGLSYKFYLRAGIKFAGTKYFSPTRDFNADDVLFSFNRQRIKTHPYHNVGGGRYEYFTSMEMDKLIVDIKKIDDHTVEFILNKPEAPFLANLAMSFASILSKEYADKLEKENHKNDIDQLPVGTGPFIFSSYQKDNLIRYLANKDYFKGAPKIDKLVFSITPDANVRVQKLKAGECHLVIEPAPADLSSLKKIANIRVISAAGLNVGYVAYNTQKKPFDNKLVRQALDLAMNKQSYIDAVYLGNAEIAKNPLPPTIWSYSKKTPDHKFNLKLAQELLTKAGHPQGFEVTMWTLPVTRPYNPNGKKMGELIQADLAKIGVKVKLISFDWPTYLSKSRMGEHQMIQMGWTGDNGDPDNFLNILLSCGSIESGSNLARWCNQDFNKLIDDARLISDQKKRSEKYLAAQKIFDEEKPWSPIAHSMVFRAMSTKVHGYVMDPLGGDIFTNVQLR